MAILVMSVCPARWGITGKTQVGRPEEKGTVFYTSPRNSVTGWKWLDSI